MLEGVVPIFRRHAALIYRYTVMHKPGIPDQALIR
jgi:hypothetical protein